MLIVEQLGGFGPWVVVARLPLVCCLGCAHRLLTRRAKIAQARNGT
jgi:hypothetical protein